MNRGRISISVFLCFLMMMLLVVSGCGSSNDALPTYSVSGTVTGASGVTMNLTGDATATTTVATDGGTYSFTGLAVGNYTVTAVKAGYTFDPLSKGGHLTANRTGQDFVATAAVPGLLPYTISGTVSGAVLAGVTITLSGDAAATTTTIAGGTYSFPGIALNGNYTVTPSLAGYTFSAISIGVIVSGADSTGNNFTATANVATTYSISGTVSGATAAGVTITLSGGTFGTAITKTGVGGTYTFAGLLPDDYIVTPSLTGYTFTTPISITLSANSTGNNFTSTNVSATNSISGAVSGASDIGVMINLTGAATRHQLTSGGSYNFESLANGVYTVTPVLAGYTFAPSSSVVTVAGGDMTADFTATANVALKYSISGTVSGAVQSVVTITLSGAGSATTTTNASGNYSFSGLVNGSYTVTPTNGLGGYTSVPGSLSPAISGAAVTGQNFVVGTAPTIWSQADLTGTWYMNNLKTGSDSGGNKWMRAMFSINPSGFATCLSMSDSGGGTTCPSSTNLTLTMNPSTGVITQTGADAADPGTNHMTMTSNKNFAAGTATNTGGSSNPRYQLTTMQKVVPGTSYSNADLQSKSFVGHDLMVGADIQWNRFDGTTDATGILSLANNITPHGDDGAQPNAGRFSVDASGTVTIDTMSGFQGFLSADKKTIVGTRTEIMGTRTYYHIMIVQVTGTEFTIGPLPAGIAVGHMLGVGTGWAGWIHFTNTVAPGGVITFSNWVDSGFGSSVPVGYTGNITTTSGTIAIDGNSTFHGQISHDGKFTVATQTGGTSPHLVYMLQVNTQ